MAAQAWFNAQAVALAFSKTSSKTPKTLGDFTKYLLGDQWSSSSEITNAEPDFTVLVNEETKKREKPNKQQEMMRLHLENLEFAKKVLAAAGSPLKE